MPPKKQGTNLGKALINNRFKTQQTNGARLKINPDGSMVKHTTEADDKKWAKMQSITQENDLEAFLSSATLAGTDFTAEKLNVQILPKGYKNPFLLDATEEAATIAKHKANEDALTVPRRPAWDGVATPEEQQRREREAFMEWRRSLVVLEEDKGLLMTPFERNIEVWRQLWRVIERSDVVVQIVDARNPLMFRSSDLDTYVTEVDKRKKNFLLVNKADMLTVPQRKAWADHFEAEEKKIEEDAELLRLAELEETSKAFRGADDEDEDDEEEYEEEEDEEEVLEGEVIEDEEDAEVGEEEDVGEEGLALKDSDKAAESDNYDEEDEIVEESYGMALSNAWKRGKTDETEEEERIRILSCEELIDRLMKECPGPLRPHEKKVTIGFVGYPNVGKSSTLNALVGANKVTVSSTPGKTKHFQTIHLSDDIILCDCPGLVFPSFATTKAEMVVNGILPIDQLREHTGPATLVALRIPRHALEIIYGIDIKTFDAEGRPDPLKVPTGEDLCQAYAVARGFKKSSQGNPDEARAARFILKDYVRGKLLYCLPPPEMDAVKFNEETYAGPEFRRQAKNPKTHEVAGEDGTLRTSHNHHEYRDDDEEGDGNIDPSFFATKSSGARIKGVFQGSGDFTRPQMYPHQVGARASAGSAVGGRKGKGKAVPMAPAGMGVGLDEAVTKKHKKSKRVKIRTNWTADQKNG
ncbi:hypothetical protein BC829DRAFT_382301 [Chytridium lagenaria]|nr:hypothetical protein BC829DRAFT_382301 [Chytridium lagenaria]